MAVRRRQTKAYKMQCGKLVLTVRQQSGGWVSTVNGPSEKYIAIETNESRAKKACVDVASAILNRSGTPIPDCLIRPQWIAN
jgi:hypothetical protein